MSVRALVFFMVRIVTYYNKGLLYELAEVHLCKTLHVKIRDSGDGLYCQWFWIMTVVDSW